MQGSLYPQDWLAAAEKDWKRVTVMLEHADLEGAAFFLQQTLEKHLKAFLLKRGWKLRKLHELDTLLDYAVEFDTTLERFRDLCEKVSGYYITERYPMLVQVEIEKDDLKTEMAEASEMLAALKYGA